jgi:hypothetical protein
VFCKTNDLLDQLVASKDPRRWWRRFSRDTRCRYKILDPLVAEIADLVWA